MQTLWVAEEGFLKLFLERTENATEAERAEARDAGFTAAELSDIMSVDGENATITIQGVMTPDGPSPIARLFGFTGASTNLIRAAVEKLTADETVKHVTLKMDTPGGSVTGTDETFQALAKLKASGKKIIAENHGMIASAGLWVAMAADEIKAMSPTVETGSIGVIVAGLDFSGLLEKAGIKQVVIVSKHAPEKAALISTKEGIAIIQRRIDAIENVFLARVADGRSVSVKKVIKDFGQGGVLIAEEAQAVGMIDSVVAPIGQITNNTKTKVKTQNNEDGKMPNLKEFLAEHPLARAELAVLEKEEFARGQAEEKKTIDARVSVAKPILTSKDYPSPIKDIAAKVMAGELSVDALVTTVALFDSQKEQAAADAAAAESEDQGETNAESPNLNSEGNSEDGVIDSEDKLNAEIAKEKGEVPEKVGS